MAARGEQFDYLVYIHKNKLNNKVYIGQTHQLSSQRWGKDGIGYRTSPHFFYAIQKYGWDNFQHIIIKNNLSAEEADELETKLIKQYNATDPDYGYNIRLGGEHGFHYTQEQKEKLSIALRKNSHNSKNAHKIYCKETNDIFGTVADAQRWANTTHISDVLMGRRQYAGRHPITGQKLSWDYAENDAIITKICKKDMPTSFNKLKGHETKILCVNTGKVFQSMREAADWCKLKDTSNISRCCRGLRKTAGKHPQTKEKLKWQYINKEEKKELKWV